MRKETRLERYKKKSEKAISIPASFVSVNFRCDENLAFLIRTAACFGIKLIHVIGSVPERKDLYNSSGSLVDFVNIKQYSTPGEFLKWSRESNINIVSAELTYGAESLYEYNFDLKKHTAIVLGNETTGVPVEILKNSRKIFIPMWGNGFCLNTSQTGTAFITEYCRQYFRSKDGSVGVRTLG